MRQSAKYAAIAYSRFSDMPHSLCRPIVSGQYKARTSTPATHCPRTTRLAST